MLHARVQRTELQIVHAGFNQSVDSFFEKIKEGEFVTGARLMRDFNQRYRDRRRRRREIRNDFFVADRFQNVLNGFLKLFERNNVLVVSEMQIEGDALGDMISQPPAWITGLVGSAIDGSVEPIAVEFEELTGIAA